MVGGGTIHESRTVWSKQLDGEVCIVVKGVLPQIYQSRTQLVEIGRYRYQNVRS